MMTLVGSYIFIATVWFAIGLWSIPLDTTFPMGTWRHLRVFFLALVWPLTLLLFVIYVYRRGQ